MSDGLTEITVVGEDDSGIVAEITSLLFERNVNIEDIDQAVREGTFRMTMRVDTDDMVTTHETLRHDLAELGEETGVDIDIRYPGSEDRSIAVLVTKESHCLEALIDAWQNDELGAEIAVVIGNHSDLEPLAAEHDIPFYDVGDENGVPDEDELLDVLDDHDTDLIALARYIRILSPKVVFRYRHRIINVHPSLLPAFPGASAYMQAIEAGARVAGVTAHYVTTDLDQGPIIAQRSFNVPDDATEDELRKVGQPLEAEVLVEAIRLHLNDDLYIHRGRTQLRNPDATNVPLGLPDGFNRQLPDEPVDSHDEIVDRETTSAESD